MIADCGLGGRGSRRAASRAAATECSPTRERGVSRKRMNHKAPKGRHKHTVETASTNPYDPSAQADGPFRDSYGQLRRVKRRRKFYLIPAFAWLAFVYFTSYCADHIRYMGNGWVTGATIIVIGNISCLVCLCLGLRGWWHLLAIPIWIFCLVELLICATYFAAAAGLITPKPWNERAEQSSVSNVRSFCAAPLGLRISGSASPWADAHGYIMPPLRGS